MLDGAQMLQTITFEADVNNSKFEQEFKSLDKKKVRKKDKEVCGLDLSCR